MLSFVKCGIITTEIVVVYHLFLFFRCVSNVRLQKPTSGVTASLSKILKIIENVIVLHIIYTRTRICNEGKLY